MFGERADEKGSVLSVLMRWWGLVNVLMRRGVS